MVYDAEREVVLLYGGRAGVPRQGVEPAEGLWALDGSGWRAVQAEGPGPGPRAGHQMVWDPERKRVLLFGGLLSDAADPRAGETWAWDGERWERLAVEGPPARYDFELVWSSQQNRAILYAGQPAAEHGTPRLLPEPLRDAWSFDGSSWEQIQLAQLPPRTSAASAYDASRERIVRFGGVRIGRPEGDGAANLTCTQDTWELDGTTWASRP